MACRTETDDQVTLTQRWAYGTGSFTSLTAGYGISSLANYIFNIALGVNPALVGVALAVPRFVDLFTDPTAGYLSDSLRERFGRRTFIAVGSSVSAIFFAMVWLYPLGLSEKGYFCWLLGFSCATSLGWSLLSVPWQALGFEITNDYNERTRLMAVSTIMGGVAGVIYGWSYAATQLHWFKKTVDGSRWVGAAMALSILVSGLIPALFCREKKMPVIAPTRASPKKFLKSLQRVFRCRPFVFLAGAVILMCLGVFSVTGIGPYIGIYYVANGNQTQGALLIGAVSTAWQGTTIFLAGPVSWASGRLGKSRALLIFLGIAFFGNILKWVCYNSVLPWLYIVPSIFFAAGFSGLWTLVPSMVADICDFEELESGVRDGGMFAAFYMWAIKLGSTLAFALGGFLVDLTGFAVVKGGAQGASTILAMRIVDFTVPATAIVLSMWLVWRYPITEQKMDEVRDSLKNRRLALEVA